MLTCVYHPIDPMRIVEGDVAEDMLASGGWFDCPKMAREYRRKVEDEIKEETKAEKPRAKHSKGK